MASNRNIPPKGQGANEPDKKQPNQQSASADAANVDWMIISDLSTRIGGSPQAKQEQQAQNSLSNSAPKSASNQSLDDDLADLEWLRSLDLDEPIERASDQKNTTSGRQNSSQNSNPVTDIDWLIVSDFKTRMDSSEENFVDSLDQNTPVSNIVPQASSTDSLDSIIDDDLGLDSLEFMGDADFSDLESLDAFGFDNAESVSNITGDELQDEIDITEGKILELSNLFDDNPSSDNALNDNWDKILEESESSYSNQPTPSSLDIIEDTFEVPTQIAGFVSNDEEIEENLDLFTDPLSDSISQEDIAAETFNHDLALGDLEEDNLQEINLFTDSNIESFDHNLGTDDNPLDNQSESIASDGFENLLEDSNHLLIDEEINELLENVASPLEDGFGEIQILEPSNLHGIDNDGFWGDVPNLDAESSNTSNISSNEVDNVFTSDWEQNNASSPRDIMDDAIWDNSTNIASEALSATSIDNAFGTFDDLESAPSTEPFAIADFAEKISDTDKAENVAINDDLAWSDELEAEISGGTVISDDIVSDTINDDLAWSADLEAEIANDIAWNEHNSLSEEATENVLNDNFDFGNSLEDDFAIADDSNYLINNSPIDDVIDDVALGNFASIQDEQAYPDIDNFGDLKQDLEQYEFNELEEIEQPSVSRSNPSVPEVQTIALPEESLELAAEWEKFREAFADQITDSNFDDDFANYVVKTVEAKHVSEHPSISAHEESIGEFQDLDSMLDENFDLASFDEDIFPETPPTNANTGISTTLTPNRPVSVPPPPDTSKIEVSLPSVSAKSVPPKSVSDPFEEALNHEILNHDYDAVDLHEEALANDLLNGYTSDESVIDKFASNSPNPSTPPKKLSSPDNFDMESSDRDFLDDFDLDSIDTQLTGDDFDSGFAPAAISTGLTPPPPPPSPPIAPIPSLSTNQDITFPSVGNPPTPPPPPFLPPLPPKRNPHQVKTPSPTVPNAGYQRPSEQNRDRKPVVPIDEGWSELLDADTVLSGVLRSPTGSPYSEPNTGTPPRSGISAGSSVGQSSQSRDRNASSLPKRKDTGLPDFNDLGLEIHDDNTDWSGLLDSGDLSDSITSISSTQLPSRGRTPPLASPRSEMTGISETREIPRDRRKPVASFDATQARMAATPDQVDFNRFTEDNYADYGYEPPSTPQPASPKQQNKLKIPSVSIESLWQDYLKIPAISLGAIGGAFLLYALLNRPIFDIGLRWGIFKDASGKDFTNADFKGAKLDNVDFSKATLTGAKMQDASLVGANFQEANLDGVNFSKANLNRARLIKASVIWAEFNNAQMNLVDLAGADLTRSNFASAKMEGANLKDSKIGAQGTEKATRFPATVLLAWQIVNEPREGRNLASQDLSGLNLSFTSLKRANLSNAKLNYTDLTGTDLRGANLTGSQINGANLSGTKLTGINLTDVAFDKTKLPKTDEETICPNNQKGPCKF